MPGSQRTGWPGREFLNDQLASLLRAVQLRAYETLMDYARGYVMMSNIDVAGSLIEPTDEELIHYKHVLGLNDYFDPNIDVLPAFGRLPGVLRLGRRLDSEIWTILVSHFGEPPETFEYDGESYTPQSFLEHEMFENHF